MRARSLRQAALFSWARTAALTLDVVPRGRPATSGHAFMNITHIYKDFAPVMGGIENHIKQLAEWQAARGHTVTVLVTQLPGAPAGGEMLNGVRVIRAARQLNVQSAPIALSFPIDVGRATAGADIAHLHAPYPIGEACNLLFGRARKTVISGTVISCVKRRCSVFTRRCSNGCWRAPIAIMPTSEKYARTSPWLSQVLAKCAPITLGIDIARFAATDSTRAQAAQLRARWISSKRAQRAVGLAQRRPVALLQRLG